MNQVFWHETKKLNILSKLRNKLTLGAFCVRCGEDNGSLHFLTSDPVGGSNAHSINFFDYIGTTNQFKNVFTFEAWVHSNIQSPGGEFNILEQGDNNAIFRLKRFNLEDNHIVFYVTKGAVEFSVRSEIKISTYKWTHIAVTYDGVTIKIFIDGIQDTITFAIDAPLDDSWSGNTFIGGFFPDTGFIGKLAEIRMWDKCLTEGEINFYKNKRVGKMSGLKRYYRLNKEPFIDYINPTLPTFETVPTDFSFDSEDYPSLITGASSLAATFDIVSGQNISLKYPINKPIDANFMLCVSYTDGTTRTRYRLWEQEGVDIAPAPVRYRGQVLPSTFKFEVWGVDGAETAELEEDLTVYFSKCSLPTTQRDIANVNLVTDPTIDTTLAAPWGSAFPITFNTAQFGTCAAPVAQILANMSSNLTVYGGTSGVHGAILQEGGGFALDEEGNQISVETN